MFTPACFPRPSDVTPPVKRTYNPLNSNVLRTTPLFPIFYTENVAYLHENKDSGEGREGGGAPPS